MKSLPSGQRQIPSKQGTKPGSAPKPRRQMSKTAVRRTSSIILSVLVFAACAGVVSLVVTLANNAGPEAVVNVDPVAQAWAELAAADFIAGQPISVPLAADVLAHPSSTPIPDAQVVWAGSEDLLIVSTQLERHHFVLLRPGFEATELSLLFDVTNSAYPVLAAEPSIVELAPILVAGANFDLGTLPQLPHSGALDRRVRTWATALATADAVSLKNEILDPEPSAVYRGVDGLVTKSVRIQSVVDNGTGSGLAIVRAVVVFEDPIALAALAADRTEEGALAAAPLDDDELATSISLAYDLLVEDVSTEAPKIRAWGPPGAGATLAPFANAYTTADN